MPIRLVFAGVETPASLRIQLCGCLTGCCLTGYRLIVRRRAVILCMRECAGDGVAAVLLWQSQAKPVAAQKKQP
jgi:hypothetical protein